MITGSARRRRRLDDAARASWLYYVANNSQEEIAQKLGLSRQSVQRLISTAMSENLVKIRIDHPVARCLDLKERIIERFELRTCEVAPSDPAAPDLLDGVAALGASEIVGQLDAENPKIIAIGSGRTLRACVEQIPHMSCPQHRLISMVGNMHLDGSATPYGVVVRLAEKVGAVHYPMPLTVLVRSPADLAVLHAQEPVEKTLELCAVADVSYVGIGNVSENAPLYMDGFITSDECRALLDAGAVGEIVGWVYDKEGKLVPGLTNDRVSSAPISAHNGNLVVGLALGNTKAKAILGALNGGLINGLITDELTAEALLQCE